MHIHIPKTGGTALEVIFRDLGDPVPGLDALLGEARDDDRWFELQHLTLDEIRDRSGGAIDGFHRFAVVRDPYQRLISEYRWRLRIRANTPHPAIAAFETCEQLVEAIPLDIDTRWKTHIRGADRSQANLLIHARPQHHYVCDSGGELDPSIELLRFEDFRRAVGSFLHARNIPSATIGQPKRHRIAEYFDNAMLQRVNAIYARDFAVLGYPMIHRVIRS